VDYIFRGQSKAFGYNRFARLNRREVIANRLKPVRSRRVENCAADPAAHLERRVSSIDDGINAEFRYIVSDD
jgi:hypothetical protein